MNRKFLGISLDDWAIGALMLFVLGAAIWWGLFRPLDS